MAEEGRITSSGSPSPLPPPPPPPVQPTNNGTLLHSSLALSYAGLKESTTTSTYPAPRKLSRSASSSYITSTLPQRRDRREIHKSRERANTCESNQSNGSTTTTTTDGKLAEFSFRSRRGNSTTKNDRDDAPMPTIASRDMKLLLASLEKEAEVVEDEAEAVSSVVD